MAAWPTGERARAWLQVNDSFRRNVLDRLGSSGPLVSRDIPDTCVRPWQSTGWTHNRNVTQMLELLAMCGAVAVAGRRGRQRLWDLAERVYPDDVVAVPVDQARRQRDARRLGPRVARVRHRHHHRVPDSAAESRHAAQARARIDRDRPSAANTGRCARSTSSG